MILHAQCNKKQKCLQITPSQGNINAGGGGEGGEGGDKVLRLWRGGGG